MSMVTKEQCVGPVLGPGRTRRSFPKEFKADAVALVLDEGRTIASVARSLGIGESNLGNWVRQARIDRGEREGLTTTERAELTRQRGEAGLSDFLCIRQWWFSSDVVGDAVAVVDGQGVQDGFPAVGLADQVGAARTALSGDTDTAARP
ncbi:MAG: transposase [Acidimicrobiales bacterium]|nr:transposase [Acidimicrobiales bacterium]MYK71421.1 transposase [Acidimicrobiales bacterium]